VGPGGKTNKSPKMKGIGPVRFMMRAKLVKTDQVPSNLCT
jgi:hypothetical protein